MSNNETFFSRHDSTVTSMNSHTAARTACTEQLTIKLAKIPAHIGERISHKIPSHLRGCLAMNNFWGRDSQFSSGTQTLRVCACSTRVATAMCMESVLNRLGGHLKRKRESTWSWKENSVREIRMELQGRVWKVNLTKTHYPHVKFSSNQLLGFKWICKINTDS